MRRLQHAKREIWYNSRIMRKTILALLVAAAFAGCEKEDDGSADFNKGVEACAARDFRLAATCFGMAAQKNATNFTARVRLALANIELGEMPAAKAAVESALELDPASAEARMIDGQIAYHMKDYARAKKDFDDVAAGKQLPAELRSEALTARAVMEIEAQLFERARLSLWRAIRLDGKNGAAWYHLGHLSRNTYHFEEAAMEQFEMASRLIDDPARVKTIGRETIPSLRDSLRAKPASKPGIANRDPGGAAKLVTEAETLAKKDPKKAAAKYAEAYAKDPLSYDAAWNHAKAAIAAAKGGAEVTKALDAFQDAIDQRPNSQDTYRTAARAALNHAHPMRAERFLSQALAHDPGCKPTLELYVQTLRRLGKTTEAKLYDAYLKEL